MRGTEMPQPGYTLAGAQRRKIDALLDRTGVGCLLAVTVSSNEAGAGILESPRGGHPS